MLGGTGSSAKSASEEFGWKQEADKNEFLVVFPEPLPREPLKPFDHHTNLTFWEMQGSRSHFPPSGMQPVDDDGYLIAVLKDVMVHEHVDRKRVYFAGFSSGSGMVQLFASRHPQAITAIAAIATPLMQPPLRLEQPVSVLYIHGDLDEQFSGFEVNSPDFATTPHGNWVTWGYLNGCNLQRARKTDWGVQLGWKGCKDHIQVIADFVRDLGHEWLGGMDTDWNTKHRPKAALDFTDMAWRFFASVHSR
jgi:polyhydroxybutyrate depolymerase